MASPTAEKFIYPVAYPEKNGSIPYTGQKTIFNTAHLAMDYNSAAADNGKIVAVYSGKILYVSKEGLYGNHAVIEHTLPSGLTVYSLYAHLVSFAEDFKVGQAVKNGALVGIMGNTGNSQGVSGSAGVHLHFALWSGKASDGPEQTGTIDKDGIGHGAYDKAFYNINDVIERNILKTQ